MIEDKDRQKVLQEMKEEFYSAIANKKEVTWKSDMGYQMVSPKSKVQKGRYLFKLRYVPNQESPFVEEQPEGLKVRLNRLNFEDYQLITEQKDIALNMFLYFSHSNKANGGNRYWMEDKEKENEEQLSCELEIAKAKNKVDSAKDTKLMGAYFSLTRRDPFDETKDTIKLELVKMCNYDHQRVLNALADVNSELKYKYLLAKRNNIIKVSDDNQFMYWKNSQKPFLQNLVEGEMENLFVEYCLNPKNANLVDKIDDELLKIK